MKFYPYQKKFNQLFKQEKNRIEKTIGDYEIEHVGSTAIPGMAGKGIIDIMIVVKSWNVGAEIVRLLKKNGYIHVHKRKNGRIFLSNNDKSDIGNYHVHIVKKNSWTWKSLVSFRDYFLAHPGKVRDFSILKERFYTQSKSDPEKYQKLKSKYIKKILQK